MIDANTLERIAELSALRFSDTERALQELNEAVLHATRLSEVNTDGVAPYAGTPTQAATQRDGYVFCALQSALPVAAPAREDGSFSVSVVE